MIGAIIGDVVGSRFEFNNIKSKKFKLVDKDSVFTDDTVLTIAVMDWILHAKVKCNKTAVEYLQKWARKYPHAGYGGMFRNWIYEDNPKPYNSCGNGSAMRISPVGWVSDHPNATKIVSDIITGVTHNHPEGLKGAYVTAQLISMARMGKSKMEMKMFAEQYYNLDFDYNELVKNYSHEAEICQITVPQALFCFFTSNDFEDCLRTTVSIGGDTDTLCAISCAIAEAYYDYVPEDLIEQVKRKLPTEMLDIINEFKKKYGGE